MKTYGDKHTNALYVSSNKKEEVKPCFFFFFVPEKRNFSWLVTGLKVIT